MVLIQGKYNSGYKINPHAVILYLTENKKFQHINIIRRNSQFILLPSIFCGVLSNQYKSEHPMDYLAQVHRDL